MFYLKMWHPESQNPDPRSVSRIRIQNFLENAGSRSVYNEYGSAILNIHVEVTHFLEVRIKLLYNCKEGTQLMTMHLQCVSDP